ncbi:putative glycosyltransferase [Cafeteria roenbergensis virus]|uniref:Putative glycosyltransferase n=1 Tax=Cafeteria roenbergensis virus (strain BV-PW1) TaxID=693272 RepID=E3T4Q8_CROVB|nr:putative glycosyltransferase [Cafeteria roenbergensis virus BV-PW1]ADO67171.1 putative glycosyltransferase [Cafeteria roenbergensis virus BV-PW1]
MEKLIFKKIIKTSTLFKNISKNTQSNNLNLLDKTKIIYINLEERQDRKNIIEKFYKNENLIIERFNAERINLNLFIQKYPLMNLSTLLSKSTKINWVNGTLGCYDSHYSILHKYQNNDENIFLVILEDDCIISKSTLNTALKFIYKNPSIDLLRINCWTPTTSNPFNFSLPTKLSKFSSINNKYYYDGGTHCCIYNIKNIPKVINFLNKEFVFNFDAILSTNQINSWVLHLPGKIKYSSKSSIQQTTLNKNKLLKLKLNDKLI